MKIILKNPIQSAEAKAVIRNRGAEWLKQLAAIAPGLIQAAAQAEPADKQLAAKLRAAASALAEVTAYLETRLEPPQPKLVKLVYFDSVDQAPPPLEAKREVKTARPHKFEVGDKAMAAALGRVARLVTITAVECTGNRVVYKCVGDPHLTYFYETELTPLAASEVVENRNAEPHYRSTAATEPPPGTRPPMFAIGECIHHRYSDGVWRVTNVEWIPSASVWFYWCSDNTNGSMRVPESDLRVAE